MAAKRFVKTSVDWAKIAERVQAEDMPKFLAFRAKSDGYLRRMYASPETPPKIDWAFYKKSVPIPGMVDTFQKQYESMQIPYPKDTVSADIDVMEKEVLASIEEFKKDSNKRIAESNEKLNYISSLLPYDQMTLEEFYEAHPEESIDALNNPTLWPHNPEEQIGYKGDEDKPAEHH